MSYQFIIKVKTKTKFTVFANMAVAYPIIIPVKVLSKT